MEAIAEGTGLAYQTTYRYLQYLVSVNRVEVSQHYGKVGRPKQRYRMIREAGDGEKPKQDYNAGQKAPVSHWAGRRFLIVRDRKSCGQNRQIKI